MSRFANGEIEIPDRYDYSIGNGIYRLSFERGFFGGEAMVNKVREGDIIEQGEIKLQVLRVWHIGTNKIYLDCAVLTAALPVFGLVVILLSATALVGMFGWSLSSLTKLFDTTGNEICYDKDGNEITCPKAGLLAVLSSLSGLVIVSTIAYLIFKWKKST